MSDTPQERWATLGALLRQSHDANWQRLSRINWFAGAVAGALADYVGLPRESFGQTSQAGMRFYSYNAGPFPRADSFTLKDSAFDSIQIDEEGFYTFAIGIGLEMAPNTLPKYNLCWFIRVKILGEKWVCQVGAGSQHLIEIEPPDSLENVTPIVEESYRGLFDWLTSGAEGRPQQGHVGFVAAPERNEG